MNSRKIVVLGGGVTGFGIAWRLSSVYKNRVILIEQQSDLGGLAATFSSKNLNWDVGSHRIHPQYEPDVFKFINNILGDQLLRRPRRGLIYIQGYALEYPPTFLNMWKVLGARRICEFAWAFIYARVAGVFKKKGLNNFESWTIHSIGRKLYEFFYKSYARKLWGVSPEQISFEPAVNRVKKFEVGRLIKGLPGYLSWGKTEHFYYPAQGIGQITEELKKRFLFNGGEVKTDTQSDGFLIDSDRKIEKIFCIEKSGQRISFDNPDLVVSTIPLDVIHKQIQIPGETEIPSFDLKWRSLRILYLQTHDGLEVENETIYLPGEEYKIGRISNINKYSPNLNASSEGTLLTLEFPCDEGDGIWSMTDSELFGVAKPELVGLGLIKSIESRPPYFFSRKLKNLYPLYTIGWEEKLENIMSRLDDVSNLFLIGRGSLFLHCNIDHCLVMAFQLADFLSSSEDKNEWINIRKTFNCFRVKD